MIKKLKESFTWNCRCTGLYYLRVISEPKIFDYEIIGVLSDADFIVAYIIDLFPNSKNYSRNNGKVVSLCCGIEYQTKLNISHGNLTSIEILSNGVDCYVDSVIAIIDNHSSSFGDGMSFENFLNHISPKLNKNIICIKGVCHPEGNISDDSSSGIICIENNCRLINDKVRKTHNSSEWVVIQYQEVEESTFILLHIIRKLLKKHWNLNCYILITVLSHIFQGYYNYKEMHIFYLTWNFAFDFPQQTSIKKINSSQVLNFSFQKESYIFDFDPVFNDVDESSIKYESDREKHRISVHSTKTYYRSFKNWLYGAYRAFFKLKGIDEVQRLSQLLFHVDINQFFLYSESCSLCASNFIIKVK